MEAEIIGKLRALLSKAISTEPDLVYLLVQLRKLHKRNGDPQPAVVKLFCNWVVHDELDEDRWANLVKTPSSPPLPVQFQQALNEVLAGYGLPEVPDVLGVLASILNDCPIVFSEDGEMYAAYMYGAAGSWVIQRVGYVRGERFKG